MCQLWGKKKELKFSGCALLRVVFSVQFNSVQLLSHVWIFATPWIATRQASLSITNSRSSSNSRASSPWCHPAISSSIVPFSSCPPIPLSIRVFSSESTLRMRWPKYWSFSFPNFKYQQKWLSFVSFSTILGRSRRNKISLWICPQSALSVSTHAHTGRHGEATWKTQGM